MSLTRGLSVCSLGPLCYAIIPLPPSASTSVHPSVLALSSLACSDPDPAYVSTFFQPIILAPSDIARSNPDPAFSSLETTIHLASASTTRAAARTSGPLAPQLASTHLHPAPETRSFIVPAPAGSDPIPHLTIITGATMSSAPDIERFIKGCQSETVTAPPPSTQHLVTPLLQYLASSEFPYTVGKP